MLVFFSTVFYFPSFTIDFFPTCTWFDQQSAGLWGVSLCLSYTSPPETVASCTIVLSLVIKASLWHPLLDSVKNWIKWNQFNKYPLPSAYCIEGAAGLGGDTWRERHRLQGAYGLFWGLRQAWHKARQNVCFVRETKMTCLVGLEEKRQMGMLLDKKRGSPEADLQAQRALRFEVGVGRRWPSVDGPSQSQMQTAGHRGVPENEWNPRCLSETDEGISEDDSSNPRREHPSEGPEHLPSREDLPQAKEGKGVPTGNGTVSG